VVGANGRGSDVSVPRVGLYFFGVYMTSLVPVLFCSFIKHTYKVQGFVVRMYDSVVVRERD